MTVPVDKATVGDHKSKINPLFRLEKSEFILNTHVGVHARHLSQRLDDGHPREVYSAVTHSRIAKQSCADGRALLFTTFQVVLIFFCSILFVSVRVSKKGV